MNRLTMRNSDGSVSQPTDLRWDIALERLAAYEDTGLTPDVCAEYKKFEDEAISKNVPFSRLVELMNADAEARVVVLPCKVGDTVYATFGYKVEERRVIEFDVVAFKPSGHVVHAALAADQQVTMSVRWDLVADKTVFLTREEAEAALKGARNGRS